MKRGEYEQGRMNWQTAETATEVTLDHFARARSIHYISI
jgi:hypothetical protein